MEVWKEGVCETVDGWENAVQDRNGRQRCGAVQQGRRGVPLNGWGRGWERGPGVLLFSFVGKGGSLKSLD